MGWFCLVGFRAGFLEENESVAYDCGSRLYKALIVDCPRGMEWLGIYTYSYVVYWK